MMLLMGNIGASIVALIAIKFFIGISNKFGFKPWGWYRIIGGTFFLIYFSYIK
ncbi:hypothetical protein FNW25_16520 [Flavobacterium franklandianum]|nr:hypothetical protein FNW25_16520 [Flavobacterium franklandianum]